MAQAAVELRAFHPTLAQARTLAGSGNLMPVWKELAADVETPVSVYLKLAGEGPSFLLESVEGGEHIGRYSFLGFQPSTLVSSRGRQVQIKSGDQREELELRDGDPLHILRAFLKRQRVVGDEALPRFWGGAVGYLAYDMVRFFERLPDTSTDELGLPDCAFLFPELVVIFDHLTRRMKVVALAHLDEGVAAGYGQAVQRIEEGIERLRSPLPPAKARPGHEQGAAPRSNFTAQEFGEIVRRAKEYIAAGDIFQVVLSQRVYRPTSADPFTIYRALRMLNPSPYMFYLDLEGLKLVGSSPEMLVKLEEDVAETRPIAGTRPRGQTPEEDGALEEELLADPKERAEHVMLVDLGRNDLGRVSRYGTVQLPALMTIERYSHVMHIVSSVKGRLEPGRDAFDLLRASFPAGTVSGAPKIRAMEIIEELEGLRRGPYAGAVGYFSYSGNMDTCITIRTIVIVDGTAYLQAGAGIVADSDPAREHQECLNKLQALAEAINMAEREEI